MILLILVDNDDAVMMSVVVINVVVVDLKSVVVFEQESLKITKISNNF